MIGLPSLTRLTRRLTSPEFAKGLKWGLGKWPKSLSDFDTGRSRTIEMNDSSSSIETNRTASHSGLKDRGGKVRWSRSQRPDGLVAGKISDQISS